MGLFDRTIFRFCVNRVTVDHSSETSLKVSFRALFAERCSYWFQDQNVGISNLESEKIFAVLTKIEIKTDIG